MKSVECTLLLGNAARRVSLMVEAEKTMELKVPADMEYALVVRMALSGFGMLAGLEVDLIDDLRTVTDECFDCLLHQAFQLKEVRVSVCFQEGRLCFQFCGERTEMLIAGTPQKHDVTQSILETLLPDVCLHCDDNGVCRIVFSIPV